MGGDIRVESALGEGASFSVQIPITYYEDDNSFEVAKNRPYSPVSGRILVAEDSPTNAMVAISMLQKMGLDYHHVTDGAAAVDVALNSGFDAILMDVSMPYLDGLSATRMLRERGYDKPIIAMTAHALKGDRDEALASGMSGYVTKPMRPAELRAELAKWLPTSKAANDVKDLNLAAAPSDNGLDKPAICLLYTSPSPRDRG